MKTRDEKIKDALAAACDAINIAITDEYALSKAEGQKAIKKIIRLFKTPFPLVEHGKHPDCPLAGKHNVSECGLPINLRKEGFELIGESNINVQENIVAALWDFARKIGVDTHQSVNPEFLDNVGKAAEKICAAVGIEMVEIQ